MIVPSLTIVRFARTAALRNLLDYWRVYPLKEKKNGRMPCCGGGQLQVSSVQRSCVLLRKAGKRLDP